MYHDRVVFHTQIIISDSELELCYITHWHQYLILLECLSAVFFFQLYFLYSVFETFGVQHNLEQEDAMEGPISFIIGKLI